MGHNPFGPAVTRAVTRVLGLDIGDKTVGVAVSDGLGLTAQGVKTVRRQSYEKDLAAIREIIEEYDATEIVAGLPKSMDGHLGPQAEKVLVFVEKIKDNTGLPVHMFDERLTTALVNKMMIQGDVSRAKRREVVDMLAAQVILQGFLDRRRAMEAREG